MIATFCEEIKENIWTPNWIIWREELFSFLYVVKESKPKMLDKTTGRNENLLLFFRRGFGDCVIYIFFFLFCYSTS